MTDQTRRDPEEWKTGDEPMTDAQASYLRTLSDDVGESFDPNMTKAQASERIDELQARSPRLSGDDGSVADDRSSNDGRRSQAEGDR